MTEYIDNILAKHNISMNNFISTIDELPLWSAPFGMMILDKIPYKKGIHVLDIGFGTGFPLLEIAQRLGSTAKLFGIDPWEETISRVIKKCNVYGIHNVSLITGNAEEMQFDNMSFDLIVSNNGLNNVYDINKVLAECNRLMKPGAKLIFTVNLPGTMVEFYKIFEEILLKHQLFESIDVLHRHIADKRRSCEDWKHLVEKNNLTMLQIEEKSFSIKYADGSAMFKHHFIQLSFLESWKEIIPVKDAEIILSEIENTLNNKAEKDKGLSLTIPYVCFVCEK